MEHEYAISGIFIKQVINNSPAGRDGTLKTGDRILEVGPTRSRLNFDVIVAKIINTFRAIALDATILQ